MKFNNKWDVLPDKEVNNRQRKERFRLYRQAVDSGQHGVFGEMACVDRDKLRARIKRRRQMNEKEDGELDMRSWC